MPLLSPTRARSGRPGDTLKHWMVWVTGRALTHLTVRARGWPGVGEGSTGGVTERRVPVTTWSAVDVRSKARATRPGVSSVDS